MADPVEPTRAAIEERIRSVEDSFKRFLDNTFKSFLEADTQWKQSVVAKIDAISRPNMPLMVSVLGLIALITITVFSVVNGKIDGVDRNQKDAVQALDTRQSQSMQSMDRRLTDYDLRQTKESEKLDERLQREYGLSIKRIDDGLTNLNGTSRERHEDAIRATQAVERRIEHIDNWMQGQIEAELQELRDRRRRDRVTP